jgi:hypothetical protein
MPRGAWNPWQVARTASPMRTARRACLVAEIIGVWLLAISPGVSAQIKNDFTPQPVRGTSQLYDVSCTSGGTCMEAGAKSSARTQTGVVIPVVNGKPGKPRAVAKSVALYELACASQSFCLAVGQRASSTSPGVIVPIVKDKPGKPRPVAANLIGVGCSAKLSCWITGVSADTSAKPVIVHTVGKTAQVKEISQVRGNTYMFSGGEGAAAPPPVCHSNGQCIGVGTANFSTGPGLIYRLKNGNVTNIQKVPGASYLTGITCTSATRCQVVGVKSFNGNQSEGIRLALRNGHPGTVSVVKDTTYLGAVACRTASRCFAFGQTAKRSQVVVPLASSSVGKAIKLSAPVRAASCSSTVCLAVGTEIRNRIGFSLRFF